MSMPLMSLPELHARREHARIVHHDLRESYDFMRQGVWMMRLSGLCCMVGAALGLTGWDSTTQGVPFISGAAVGVNAYVFWLQYVPRERGWIEYLRRLRMMPALIADIEKLIVETQRNEGQTKNENQA